jgi:hypothetical protein
MSAQTICAECDRLWEDYIQAVAAHLGIIAERHKAAIQDDSAVPNEMLGMEVDLTQREIKARRAIDEHEAAHEPA